MHGRAPFHTPSDNLVFPGLQCSRRTPSRCTGEAGKAGAVLARLSRKWTSPRLRATPPALPAQHMLRAALTSCEA